MLSRNILHLKAKVKEQLQVFWKGKKLSTNMNIRWQL